MHDASEIVYSVIRSRMKKKHIQDLLPLKNITNMLFEANSVFDSEGVVVDVPSGIHVVGDIHGNIDDLLRIFEEFGYPPKTKYLFLGDYGDRGKYGLEVIIFLLSLKVKFPECVFLIRGNHELLNVSQNYGFLSECQLKYTSILFYQIHQIFRKLPIVAIVSKRIICVHGGIGPELTSVDMLRVMLKVSELSESSILTDIVWSDPREGDEEFTPNERGCGYYFNSKALDKFLRKNDLDLLIRSHELCNGYDFPFSDTERCITVFSSSNYCGKKNNASVINVSSSLNVTVTNFTPRTSEEMGKWIPEIPSWILSEIKNNEKTVRDSEEPSSEIDLIHADQNHVPYLSVIY
jgi:diadenosine tetraphosphatase ApaH/serine/threonine PP2A family protein phosphatase